MGANYPPRTCSGGWVVPVVDPPLTMGSAIPSRAKQANNRAKLRSSSHRFLVSSCPGHCALLRFDAHTTARLSLLFGSVPQTPQRQALAAARNGRVERARGPQLLPAAAPTRSAAPRRRAASTCSASLRAQLPRRGPRAAAGQRATPAGPSTCLPPPATLAALLWARQQRRAHGRLPQRAAVKRSTSTPIKELTGAHLPSRSHPTPAPRVTRPAAQTPAQ